MSLLLISAGADAAPRITTLSLHLFLIGFSWTVLVMGIASVAAGFTAMVWAEATHRDVLSHDELVRFALSSCGLIALSPLALALAQVVPS